MWHAAALNSARDWSPYGVAVLAHGLRLLDVTLAMGAREHLSGYDDNSQ